MPGPAPAETNKFNKKMRLIKSVVCAEYSIEQVQHNLDISLCLPFGVAGPSRAGFTSGVHNLMTANPQHWLCSYRLTPAMRN
jgi:hypothetical protein